jgi:hypothetical protein
VKGIYHKATPTLKRMPNKTKLDGFKTLLSPVAAKRVIIDLTCKKETPNSKKLSKAFST